MESKQVQTDSEGNVLTVMTQLLHGLAVAETVEGFFFIQGLGRVDVKFKKPRSSQTVDMEVGTSPPSERRGKKRRSDQSDQESEDESHPTQAMASLNRSKTKKTEKTGVKLNAKDFIQNLQDQNLDTKSVSQMDIETKSVLSVDPETGRKTEEEATFGSQDLSHIQNSHAFNGIGTRGSSLGDVLVPETESLDKEQVREALEDLSFVAVEETVVS
jgi:beta-xylosidase